VKFCAISVLNKYEIVLVVVEVDIKYVFYDVIYCRFKLSNKHIPRRNNKPKGQLEGRDCLLLDISLPRAFLGVV